MNYETEILAAFNRLGFKPRAGQVEAVDKILTVFLLDKKQNLILNAPTGTGKSLIGAVAADALSAIKHKTDGTLKSSISLTASNVLSAQYSATFEKLSGGSKYLMIKGANNYPCSAMSTEQQETAEACSWFTMIQNASEFGDTIARHCDKCDYLKTKKLKNLTKHLTTNYSYFFVDRMYTGKFENRDLIIWDEAHLINDLFSEHNAIYFSQKRLQSIAQDIADNVRLTDISIAKSLNTIAADCAKKNKINETTYETYLRELHKIYTYAKEQGAVEAERAMRANQMGKYSKLARFTKKYEGLACKIGDLFTYNYEHVLDHKEETSEVAIKPVFVGKMMDALQCADHNLFMSATITNEMMIKTLNLDPTKTEFVTLAPTFPKENKEFVFFAPQSLNFTSLQNPDTVKTLRKNVAKIVRKHSENSDRGIILTPSFKLQKEIVSELLPLVAAKGLKLFIHEQGQKLEQVLNQFKAFKGSNAVLISPAMFEGIDLAGDLSRYQILVKAPFPSLGDKRMKFILDHHADLYETLTIQKMVQGAGRSVRSAEDFAVTYCLDQHGQRIFSSPRNIWKNEFNLRFTSFLD